MNIVVSPKHLIEHEILSVTTSMRKNSRWASSARLRSARDTALASSMGLRQASVSDSTGQGREREDVDLMVGFEELKREIRDAESKLRLCFTCLNSQFKRWPPDVMELHLMVLLKPFLALIRSSLSTGPITSAALMSLHTFFVSGLIQPTSVGVRSTLASLSNTVANCKFEASDFAGDEAVLLRIMSIIRECMCGSVGTILGDVEVCEMLETVLTICCQMRASGSVASRSDVFYTLYIYRQRFCDGLPNCTCMPWCGKFLVG
jgi:golgi-specific brefeldin A-resistance guanine nucleotide exchange factor 1